MIEILKPPRTYPPVGRCIYCKTEDSDLRREHIIPFGLGGNAVLPRASCRKCEAVTGRTEQIVLRGMLGPLRLRLDLPTRNKKDRPTRLNLEVVGPDGKTETENVDVRHYPQYLSTFVMPPPGILEGKSPGTTITITPRMITSQSHGSIDPKWRTSLVVQPWPFLRMLAKIAHAFAVAELGWRQFETFTPLLNEIILETSSQVSHFIGCISDARGAPHELHWLSGQSVVQTDTEYLVVDICLFASMRAPVFRAIVGKRPVSPSK